MTAKRLEIRTHVTAVTTDVFAEMMGHQGAIAGGREVAQNADHGRTRARMRTCMALRVVSFQLQQGGFTIAAVSALR